MKKHLKLNKDERLHEWIQRLTAYYDNNDVPTKEMAEILREVSVQSYIRGSEATDAFYLQRRLP
jgi:hypothetical protein